jgi:membrane protein YdbS with pleckstrin-like domain
MKTPLSESRLTIGIISALVLILAVLLISAPVQLTPQAAGAGSPDLQSVTPTPTIDPSEVGSTNGIVILAFAIVGIVVLPVILRWKDWAARER